MSKFTEEKNTLMLISLMKAHGVRKIIASPGTTNVALVASLQADPWFEIYSSVDERSAGYIACGMAAESGEPVALSCTQATASRNYLSALTEAYYRKLPILAITSTQHLGRIGQNIQQAIDRTQLPVDTVKLSVHIPIIHTADDEWACNVSLNNALLELCRNGGGPVHINLTTSYSRVFNVDALPEARVIRRFTYGHDLPRIGAACRVAIYVGAHKAWSDKLSKAVTQFCGKYDAVVLCDQVSNYKGKYRVNPSLLLAQQKYKSAVTNMDLLIHIGDTSGASTALNAKEVWRVNPDGEIRDTFRKLSNVFSMNEADFFQYYVDLPDRARKTDVYLREWKEECNKILSSVKELPFSNAWLAYVTLPKLPENATLHMGIYNSLRTWSYFEAPESVLGYSNTGGFGIDGGVSSLIGASLVNEKLNFMIVGDLAFFYDMNSLGNRHLKSNIRILLVNNGCGQEFKNPDNRAFGLGDAANPFISAWGHYGNKSPDLVRHYAEDLGFKYLSASCKKEYLDQLSLFLSMDEQCPIFFEVFLNSSDETEALKILYHLETSATETAKSAVRSIIGEKGVQMIKKSLNGILN